MTHVLEMMMFSPTIAFTRLSLALMISELVSLPQELFEIELCEVAPLPEKNHLDSLYFDMEVVHGFDEGQREPQHPSRLCSSLPVICMNETTHGSSSH